MNNDHKIAFYTNDVDCPCKDCKKREVGCHEHCYLYRKYQSECTEINKTARENIQKQNLYNTFTPEWKGKRR